MSAQFAEDTHGVLQGSLRRLDSLPSVISLAPTATAGEAVTEMINNRVGCVLVTEDSKLVGLFSERDVLTRLVAKGLNPAKVVLQDVMTSDPECLTRDSKLAFVLNKMTVGGFRHIPIVDDQSNPEAVVSMRDVVEYVVSFYANLVFNLPDSERGKPSSREGA